MTRLIMIVVLILVVAGIVLAAAGVLHFQNTKDQTGVTVDKKELKEKAEQTLQEAGEAGSKILDKTSETLHKAADRVRGSADDRRTPATQPAPGDDAPRQADRSQSPPESREHQSVR